MSQETNKFQNLSFYNMLAHLNFRGNMIEELVAVKNVWKKDDNIFLDLYFYRSKKSQVLAAQFIHDMFDLSTEKFYETPAAFMEDYLGQNNEQERPSRDNMNFDFRYLEDLRDDLIILTFIAKCNNFFSNIKANAIYEYIDSHKSHSRSLSDQYLNAYLKSLNPGEEDFYQALNNLQLKTVEDAEDIANHVVKIALSDGSLQYNERVYLAEILQTLREHSVEPDVGL